MSRQRLRALLAQVVFWAGMMVGAVLVTTAHQAYAAEEQTPAAATAAAEGAVAEEKAEAEAEAVEPAIDLRETLGLDQFGVWLELRLAELGLTTTTTGRALASLAVLLLLLLALRLIPRSLDRLRTFAAGPRMPLRLDPRRLGWYQRLLSVLIRVVLLLVAALALMVIWLGAQAGAKAAGWIIAALAQSIDLAVLLLVAAIVFEVASATIEHYFSRWAQLGSSRLNTLLPIARNVAYGVLLVLFGLTFLSELGINVMPLLAGAGVVGFAVGFGAQTFIKDLITGFVIIFEDLIQVGDVVNVGGHSGAVERITIRKVQLRGMDGTVFTVPFGAISTVANLTKDFSFYVLNVSIAYRESPDEVIALLRKIALELKADPDFTNDILDPIDVMGVDQFGDNAIVIKARVKTLPIKQWRVGREFNRRMKYVFDQHNIEIPFPHRTLYFGEDKQGKAPSLHLAADNTLLRAAELNKTLGGEG